MLALAGMIGYLLGKNNSNTINTANQINPQLNSQQPSNSSGQPAPVPAGKCGDGVCGPVETQFGVCPKDCGQTSAKSPDNQLQPQKPSQFIPSFQQEESGQ